MNYKFKKCIDPSLKIEVKTLTTLKTSYFFMFKTLINLINFKISQYYNAPPIPCISQKKLFSSDTSIHG